MAGRGQYLGHQVGEQRLGAVHIDRAALVKPRASATRTKVAM